MNDFFHGRKQLFWYEYLARSKDKKIKHLTKAIFSTFFKKWYFEIPKKDHLFLISFPRKDYIQLLGSIQDCCSGSKGSIKLQRKLSINLLGFLLFFKHLNQIKSIKTIHRPKNIDGKIEIVEHQCDSLSTMTIYLKLIMQLCIYTTASREFSKGYSRSITVLCDVWPIENVVIEAANAYNLKTTTCQHGLFIENINGNTWDMLNYWEVPSRYQLAWGLETVKCFERYNREIKSIVCGNPSIKEPDVIVKEASMIGIIFDQPLMKQYNENMLKVVENFAKAHKMTIKVRIHPLDNENNYDIDKSVTSFGKNINNAVMIVGHSSTMIYTYMICGYSVFKYESGLNNWHVDPMIMFSTSEELQQCHNHIETFDFQHEGGKQITYIGKEASDEYKAYFDAL